MSSPPDAAPNLAELVLRTEAIAEEITPDLLMNTALATELRSAAEDMVALMAAPDGPHGRLADQADALAALLGRGIGDAEALLQVQRIATRLAQDVHHAIGFAQRCAKVVHAVAETAAGIVGHTDRIERAVEEIQRAVVVTARSAA